MYINTILSLGSNMGNRSSFLDLARTAIHKIIGSIFLSSSIYETEPWGIDNQDFYLNQVISVDTTLSPQELLSNIHSIEKSLGRQRIEHFGHRTIDIDILYYGSQIINEVNLKIPHPFISKRRFILVPLSEILPDFIHPEFRKSNLNLLEEIADVSKVIKWKSTTFYEK